MTEIPNEADLADRRRLERMDWTPDTTVDLHEMGVHWFDPEILPTWITPATYATMVRRGLTPPVALPRWYPPDVHERMADWLEINYHRLYNAGISYLDNLYNVNDPSEYDDADLRICYVRLTHYDVIDGSFSAHVVDNFMRDYTPRGKIFTDFAFRLHNHDVGRFGSNGFPLQFGVLTRRPLRDFDLIATTVLYPGERANYPLTLVCSGVPLYRWERFDPDLPYVDSPLTIVAGLGSTFSEPALGDNPVKGGRVGENALADLVAIGEGEMLGTNLFWRYADARRDGVSKTDFVDGISNDLHSGLYDPRNVLFEYAAKVAHRTDHTGRELSEPVVYPQGGPIRRASLIDRKNRELHTLVGEGNEEFEALEPIHLRHRALQLAGLSPEELQRMYGKLNTVDAGEAPLFEERGEDDGEER